jgi:hypothetical protein
MATSFLPPQLTFQLTKIINEMLQLKDKRLDEILEWFEKQEYPDQFFYEY